MTQRDCSVGDRVRIVSGPYEGRSGTVTHVRGHGDVLFSNADRSLTVDSLLQEPYALVKTRLTAEVDGEQRDDEIGVPVRRLRPL